jgi:hypothetical protein
MTTVQMLALAAVLAAFALTYLPLHAIKLPTKSKPRVLAQVEAIVAVREAYTDTAIVAACNTLLQALLQVKQ